MRFVVPAEAKSWVPGADGSGFPIQNLPYGTVIHDSGGEIDVVRIGDFALNLDLLAAEALLPKGIDDGDPLMIALSNGPEDLAEVRKRLFELLKANSDITAAERKIVEQALIPLSEVEVVLPIPINAFVDFYSGIHHASNVGKMFRPDQPPLLPNYLHIPIGYNGRASSVVVSGMPIVRPNGQTKAPNDAEPRFGPTNELDFELELGVFTSFPTEMGVPASIQGIENLILGVVLVNDWSARDVQRWEYQPLGPFLAKSFATSISPWVVPLDALLPFQVQGMPQDPEPLPYLKDQEPRSYDIHLEVTLKTAKAKKPQTITRTNAQNLYWSFRQQLAHQASNGTPLGAGDLYATGTISGPEKHERGSMLEITWRGTEPIAIEETGETRTFLEDGDTLTMTGWCENDLYRISLGEVTTTILGSVEEWESETC